MRILLDATAVPADRGGVGRYLDELVPALADTGVDLVVACQERDVDRFGAHRAVDVVPAPGARGPVARRLAWEQTGLVSLARRLRPDVLHSPHYTMPLATGVPTVVTLHDATFFSHPDAHLALKARFFRTATRVALRRAAAVVVPSAATRDEIARYAGRSKGPVHVAQHGVDLERFRPTSVAEQERVATSLGLAGRTYVGFLGTLEPRKNVPALVRAWVRSCEGSDAPPALVLAGGRGWDDTIDAALAAVPARLTVLRPGYLPLDDLPGFLAGAVVLAYPSLAEGFGLPVLEAMACGATVLTTRETSLAEVGGEAVAYCGTDDGSISAELSALLADPARREALAGAAVARARTFTWARSAAQHVEAYQAALRSR
ncbi:glycosyltransferase family 4 protein [Cellulomonas sp. URHB0016]